MAKTLIEGMSEAWEPQKYHDEYREALLKVIDDKIAAGGKELPTPASHAPKAGKVVDLVSVLQESLNQAQAAKKAQKKRHKAA